MNELKAQYVIRRAIDEKDLPLLSEYEGLQIEQEVMDIIHQKQEEFWMLVEQHELIKNTAEMDVEERNDILADMFDDEAIRLLTIYHLDQGNL